jgi:hypothetical protein
MSTIEERLYLETDSSCAYCGFRDNRALTIHHIEGAEPKDEAYDNKILLCHNCHQCHHHGKGPTKDQLETVKRRLIIKSLTQLGLNAMKEANRRGQVSAFPFLVNHLIEFGYLKFKEPIWTSVEEDEGGTTEQVMQGWYTITDDGRRLLEKWRLQ